MYRENGFSFMKRKELCFFSYVKQEVNSDSFKLLLLTVKWLCLGFFLILTITLLEQQEQVMDSVMLPPSGITSQVLNSLHILISGKRDRQHRANQPKDTLCWTKIKTAQMGKHYQHKRLQQVLINHATETKYWLEKGEGTE